MSSSVRPVTANLPRLHRLSLGMFLPNLSSGCGLDAVVRSSHVRPRPSVQLMELPDSPSAFSAICISKQRSLPGAAADGPAAAGSLPRGKIKRKRLQMRKLIPFFCAAVTEENPFVNAAAQASARGEEARRRLVPSATA